MATGTLNSRFYSAMRRMADVVDGFPGVARLVRG